MLAAYGRAFPELVPSEPKGAFFDRLESMLVARACVIDKRTSMQQTSAEVDQPERTLLARLVNRLETEIETLNASIMTRILSDPDLVPRYRILMSIPGIGPVNAAMLCCLMPEPGSIGNCQAASLIGVAPFSRDSGKAQGARHGTFAVAGGGREICCTWQRPLNLTVGLTKWPSNCLDLTHSHAPWGVGQRNTSRPIHIR